MNWRGRWRSIGPGIITGAADNDPAGIATYAQTGAVFGFGLGWLAAWCVPLMVAVQEAAARVGQVSGEGFMAVIRRRAPRSVLSLLLLGLVLANAFNIGADLAAMADALVLVVPSVPSGPALLGIAGAIAALIVLVPYRSYARILRWTTLSLLAYVASAVLVIPSWREILHTAFIPSWPGGSEPWLMVTAFLGTTLSPYLFVWQSNEEVEEEIDEGRETVERRQGATKSEIAGMRFDAVSGMAASQAVAFCILATAAVALRATGAEGITSGADAARLLEPVAGRAATVLFALGILGTGALAIPVLAASSAYALADVLRWPMGLGKTFFQAREFYLVIVGGIVAGLGFNVLGIPPYKALIWSAILNGIVAGPFAVAVMVAANDRKAMGKHRSGVWSNFGVSLAALALFAVPLVALADYFGLL
jgi:NRAMP (natural resistance-associated macrophage protein)-like metal ion transporter